MTKVTKIPVNSQLMILKFAEFWEQGDLAKFSKSPKRPGLKRVKYMP